MTAAPARLFALLWLLLIGIASVSRASVDIDSQFTHEALGDDLHYFQTQAEQSHLEAARQPDVQWQRPDKNPPNFGFSKASYWFKTELRNVSGNEQRLLLSIDYPLLDHIEIYLLDQSVIRVESQMGDLLPFGARPVNNRHFIVPLTLAPNSNNELYVYLRTSSSAQLPLSLWSKDVFYQQEVGQSLGLGIYFGILAIMVLYNLFLFLTIKETSYLFYVVYVTSWVVFQAGMTGHAYQYLWPDSPRWNDIAIPFSVFATNLGATLFGIRFLSLKERAPRLYRGIMGLVLTTGVFSVATFFLDYAITIRAAALITAISSIVMLVTGLYLWKQGLKHARFYALGWSAFLAGGALLSLTVMGILPLNFITEHGVKIGSVIEVVLLSFALADRFNMERAEKQIVQQKMQQMQFEMYKESFKKKEQVVAAESAIRAKDEFLSTMSHEIRTPMNGVVGVLQLFQDTPINAEQKELLRIMNGSAQTLLSIINDILDFSKIQAGKMQIEAIPFNLHELLQDLASLYSMTTKLKDNTEFVLDIAADVPAWVVGDPVRVKQILTNYLNNAIKFTLQGRIELHARKDIDEHIRFSVVDSGIGISAEGLGKLFQSFSQVSSDTSRKYGGTGLGLSICKKLSELMGGGVGASSVPGQGSTFWCSVRLQECAPPASVEPQQLISGDRLGHLRILVAEDNSVNQFVVRNMLKKLGINSVDIAENGEEAVRLFCSRPYDLILMDCQMPVKDGFETTELIRDMEKADRKPRIPIAALTASATQEEQQRCRDIGMDFHIAKPLRLEELKAALEYLATLAVAA